MAKLTIIRENTRNKNHYKHKTTTNCWFPSCCAREVVWKAKQLATQIQKKSERKFYYQGEGVGWGGWGGRREGNVGESIIEIKTNEIEIRCQHLQYNHAPLINGWQASQSYSYEPSANTVYSAYWLNPLEFIFKLSKITFLPLLLSQSYSYCNIKCRSVLRIYFFFFFQYQQDINLSWLFLHI